jgi:UDP-GlcNAc3NAcA epimerase
MEARMRPEEGSPHRWISIVGARPQFVKLAPVCRAIEAHNQQSDSPAIEHIIIHTGQHYDREIAGLFFTQMEIPEPHYNLAVGSGSHGTQIARMLERIEPILENSRPDWVVIYGDTNSTLAGALLAARMKIPIAHVEAGCRSGDTEPEEQNRIVADHLSRLLLAPSEKATDNLRGEGLGREGDPHHRRVALVGDVMFDALLQNRNLAEALAATTLAQFGIESKRYYLLTIHRAENTDDAERLRGILSAASALDLPVLFPVHPRTRQSLAASGALLNGSLRPIAPLGYLEMLAAEMHAHKILTDSGGVQKDAFYLDVPCVTLREKTEWPETVAAGANRIGGNTPASIHAAVFAEDSRSWKSSKPYGDGHSAEKIVKELLAPADAESSLHQLSRSSGA